MDIQRILEKEGNKLKKPAPVKKKQAGMTLAEVHEKEKLERM